MSASEQAGNSTNNPTASGMQTRILIELQLLTFLLYQAGAYTDDIAKLRQDIADSLT